MKLTKKNLIKLSEYVREFPPEMGNKWYIITTDGNKVEDPIKKLCIENGEISITEWAKTIEKLKELTGIVNYSAALNFPLDLSNRIIEVADKMK